MSCRKGVDEGDAGLEGHGRGEFFLPGWDWREAVEHESGADEICSAAGEVEESG